MLVFLIAVTLQAPIVELRNGKWLVASGFEPRTMYVVDARLTDRRPIRVDSVIDLRGGFVVPPFGEAHNHNIDFISQARFNALIARYLDAGVFYFKNPAILPRGRDSLRGRTNTPSSLDAVFSLGVLTATDGHPAGLWKRNVERAVMRPEDGDGAFFWLIDTKADLDRTWPRILAQQPDFIKTILAYSEEYGKRKADPAYFSWKGLDPALLPEIVKRAHARGLRVSAHVETAADFRNALRAGVDEINHVPGFRGDQNAQLPNPQVFELTVADARLAADKRVVVVTTAGGAASFSPTGADSLRRRAFDRLMAHNLRVLHNAGVHLAIGSDNYGDVSTAEVEYLRSLGVFTNLELLRMWSQATPRAIFPGRKVGCLENGCEASLLVLGADPTVDLKHATRIQLRLKNGRVLQLPSLR